MSSAATPGEQEFVVEELAADQQHQPRFRSHMGVAAFAFAGLLMAVVGWRGFQDAGAHSHIAQFINERRLDDAKGAASTDHGKTKQQLEKDLPQSRKEVRAKLLTMVKEGKSIEEIKKMGYSSRNLGCKKHKNERAALKRCVSHLKDGLTPLQLDELLDLRTDHEAQVLFEMGLEVKTCDWKEGQKVLMQAEGKGKKSYLFRKVRSVAEDEVILRHVHITPSDGTGEMNGHKFTVYSLDAWKSGHAKTQEQLGTALPQSRKENRAKLLKMVKEGKSIEEIKKMGYSSRNLGCKKHTTEKAALKRCLSHLKDGLTPLQLDELLDLTTDHEAQVLFDMGLEVKTGGWKEGQKVLMQAEGKGKKSYLFQQVTSVTKDEVLLRQVHITRSDGTGEMNDHSFTVYSLDAWKE